MEGTFFFLSIGAIIIVISYLRHRERMEMLNRGVNPVKVTIPTAPRIGSFALFIGLLAIGLGISLFLGGYLFQDADRDILMGAVILLCSGFALLLYWKLTAKDREYAHKAYMENMAAIRAELEKKNTGSEMTENSNADTTETIE